MKYIKKFNESNIDALEELKDFCESNLAFLLDEEYIINYYRYSTNYNYTKNGTIINPIYSIEIVNRNRNTKLIQTTLYWDDMKDYIIPFLERLSNNYTLHSFEDRGPSWTNQSVINNDSHQIYIGIRYIDQSISVPQIILKECSYNNIINDKVNIDDKIHSIIIQVKI